MKIKSIHKMKHAKCKKNIGSKKSLYAIVSSECEQANDKIKKLKFVSSTFERHSNVRKTLVPDCIKKYYI